MSYVVIPHVMQKCCRIFPRRLRRNGMRRTGIGRTFGNGGD